MTELERIATMINLTEQARTCLPAETFAKLQQITDRIVNDWIDLGNRPVEELMKQPFEWVTE